MLSLDIPFAAAETAAPFLRLCPAKPVVEMPARRSNSLILSTRYCLLNGPTRRANKGWDGLRGYLVNKVVRARTGQMGDDGTAAS